LGLGVRLTTSPCKKKFVENLQKKTILEEAKAYLYSCGATDDDDDDDDDDNDNYHLKTNFLFISIGIL
jgi:hypothetical protein